VVGARSARGFFLPTPHTHLTLTLRGGGRYLNLFTSILFVTLFGSLLGATCLDPGVLEKGTGSLEEPPTESHGAKWCAVCELWQPRRATHCKDCDCCVEEFDHHCPWMGKCVAKGNLTPFYIFTSMIGVVPVYLIMVLLLGPMLRSRK